MENERKDSETLVKTALEGGGIVHLFFSITTFRHTGAILQTKDRLEKYDFGYGTMMAAAIGLQQGRKYYHLNIEDLDEDFIQHPEYYATSLLFSLPYENLDPAVMLDSSVYTMAFNNCRHYILRLLKRLSKGRKMTPEENRAYQYFKKIALNARPHKPCKSCLKCTQYIGQGHSTMEIGIKEIPRNEVEEYRNEKYFRIVKGGKENVTVAFCTSVSEADCVP